VTKSLNNRSILLVGPERDVREVIADSLETEGARVYEATNRDEALLALREETYDALILDLLLQGENEVLKVAKEHQPTLGVLLIGETGGAARSEDTHHLNKPFRRDALLGALRRVFSVATARALGSPAATPPEPTG